jgi:formylglycine-generating enzyme required for sulfatase activity
MSRLIELSERTEAILCPLFEWCFVPAGSVSLLDASDYGGTKGGTFHVLDFAIGMYLITNGQYQIFIEHPNGFNNVLWWNYSPQAAQWRKDHAHPKPPAFAGRDLPCTRVSWFDSITFCHWLSAELNATVRLPTEQEWQRAAVGDTGWRYPWGSELDERRANYGNHIRQVSKVGSFPYGQSPFGVMDVIGNVWEW